MDYKKKLKIRQDVAIGMIIAGIAFDLLGIFANWEMASGFGTVFLVMGIARIVQYRRLAKDPEALHQREITETDERNIMLWTKARSLAFMVYIIALALTVIVMNLFNIPGRNIVLLCMMGFIVIYWICYFIIVKKN